MGLCFSASNNMLAAAVAVNVPGQPSVVAVAPLSMQPTGATIVSQSGVINYVVKPNSKYVAANMPEIKASIVDLTDSMKGTQRDLFNAFRLIPMLVTVENGSDEVIHVSSDVLDYGVGLSYDKVKDSIIKNFKLKKYGDYTAMAAYRVIVLTSLIAAAAYFPYSEFYSFLNHLAASSLDAFSEISASTYTMLSEIPTYIKTGVGILSLGLIYKYLDPAIFMHFFHGLVDKYNQMQSPCAAQYAHIKELNRAIDFVITSSSNKNDFEIKPGGSRQLVIFVKNTDAANIKNGILFPVLGCE